MAPTQYASYSDYTTTYLGTAIASADFSRLCILASAMIDILTFSRAAAIVTAATETATIEKIKLATCAVADVLNRTEQSGGQVVQSESIGRASVTYANPGTQESQAFRAAKIYLWPTGLMYRGFTADER